jgi:hypothetical protein
MIDWEAFKTQLQTNPGKLLKSVLLLAGCLLLIWMVVMLQGGSPAHQETIQINKSGQLSGLNNLPDKAADSLTVGRSAQTAPNMMDEHSGSGLYVLLPTILIFFIVIGGLWYWIRSKNAATSGKTSGEVFTTIASQKVPGGQQMLIVRLNGEYWVMATGGTQGLTLLHRYPPEEWKALEQYPIKADGEDTFWQTLKATAVSKNNQDA